MDWHFLKKLFPIKLTPDPSYEKQKLIWNDGAKIERRVHEILAHTLAMEINLITPQSHL
jgi:hypothetical protein